MVNKPRLGILLSLISVGIMTMVGCGGGSYDSPEAVFEAAQSHMQSKDFEKVIECYTSETVDMMVGGMVVSSAMMKAFSGLGAELGGQESKAEKESQFAKIDKILAKYGATEEKLKEVMPENPMEMAGQSETESISKLADVITDKAAFVGEMLDAFEGLGEKGGQQSAQFDKAFSGKLTDLKIDGEEASGFIVSNVDGQESKQPIQFRKEGGGWLLHEPMKGRTP